VCSEAKPGNDRQAGPGFRCAHPGYNVFIGTGMDEDAIRARLDACLVRGKPGMDVSAWRSLPDPFPVWQREAS